MAGCVESDTRTGVGGDEHREDEVEREECGNWQDEYGRRQDKRMIAPALVVTVTDENRANQMMMLRGDH